MGMSHKWSATRVINGSNNVSYFYHGLGSKICKQTMRNSEESNKHELMQMSHKDIESMHCTWNMEFSTNKCHEDRHSCVWTKIC